MRGFVYCPSIWFRLGSEIICCNWFWRIIETVIFLCFHFFRCSYALREVIEKKPEEFKIGCLKDIAKLFPWKDGASTPTLEAEIQTAQTVSSDAVAENISGRACASSQFHPFV